MNSAAMTQSAVPGSMLPTGTVTYLLTDVAGSTRLWERHPDEMAVAVARHYELLDSAVALHRGERPVEQGGGDSIVAVFARASDALAAALDVQLAFGTEHVFGLRHPDLPTLTRPLRSLNVMPNNLPTEMTSFVGRRAELTAVRGLLAGSRLLTLTGAGGCGKTRLALQAASDAMDDHPDGVWWIALARLEEPELLAAAVMASIGLREVPGRAPTDILVAHLSDHHALLVLDNCEHLLAPCAELAALLMAGCRNLTVMATSRAPLAVAGETPWRVPSMSLSAETADDAPDAARLSDAVGLFAERARLVRPNFAITVDNAATVARICRDLDGIPLAIELAATRVRVLTPDQIARGLGDRFHLLTRGSRTALPRHQTLRASMQWSHDLLDPDEQVLLRRLATFVGGWTLDAAEEVCAGDGIARYAVLDLLAGLVDESLVTTREHGAEMRYGLLETVRQYAAEQLAASGELETVRDRHRGYFVGLAEGASPQLISAGGRDPVVRRLEAELPNLRAALDWATATGSVDALRIVTALELLWLFTGRYREGDGAYARALDACGEAPAPARGFVLAARANLGLYGGDAENAPVWAQAALAIGEQHDDARLVARSLNSLGLMVALGDPRAGRQLLARAAALAAQVGDDWCHIDAQQCVAVALLWQDDFDEACAVLDDVHLEATRLGYRWGLAWHGFFRGIAALYRGRLDDAGCLFADAVEAADDVGDPLTRAFAGASIAFIELARGDAPAARAHAVATLERTVAGGAMFAFGWVADRLGRAELALGEHAAARAHLQAALASEGTAYMRCEQLVALGTLERLEGDLVAAAARGREAETTARDIGSELLRAQAERLLGRVASHAADAAGFERHVHDALGRLDGGGFALYVPDCLEDLAAVASAQESFEEAARLLGSAAAARTRLGVVRFPPEPGFAADVQRAARDALGEPAYAAAFAAGAALSAAEAIAYARRARGERKRPSRGWESLTPTEREVVRHVAAGLTNPQIGELMFITRGTVKVHLSHVFAKLAVATRSELAAEATRRGLDTG